MNFRAPWVSRSPTAYRMSRLSSRSGATSRRYRSACREPWSSAYRSSRLVTACAKVGALGQLLGPGQGRLAQLPVRLTAGCAVVAVTVAATDDDLLDHAGTIFRTWTERLTELCAADGMNPESARRLAVTVIAATEGAVALSRAERSREPFEDVSATLLSLSQVRDPH